MMNPQSFVLGILFIVIGIPVISRTIISLIHGPKENRKSRREARDKNSQMLEEIYYGLGDLGKRVKNLETILDAQEDGDE